MRPSGDVRIMPEFPTATNCVPDQVTPLRVAVEIATDVFGVHVIPSDEVSI